MSSRASAVDPAVRRPACRAWPACRGRAARIAAAGDQLLGLREELDLADAAAAELDVVALDRDLAVPAIGVDLPLHRVHVGDGGEVEIFAPDEGRQIVEQRLARRDVAGAGARLDHRRALPVLADALVVVERRRGRDRRSGSRPDPAAAADRCGTHSRRPCAPAAASPAAASCARTSAPARCRPAAPARPGRRKR